MKFFPKMDLKPNRQRVILSKDFSNLRNNLITMKSIPKYIKYIVERANKQLAHDKVQEIDNQLYLFIHSYLTNKKIAHSTGYFRYVTGGKVEEIVDFFSTPIKGSFIQIVL